MKGFDEFLHEHDAPTEACEPETARDREFHTRGEFRGQWLALWMLREIEGHGVTDLHVALAQFEAGLKALKRRRSPRDFWTALERAANADDTNEGEHEPWTDKEGNDDGAS